MITLGFGGCDANAAVSLAVTSEVYIWSDISGSCSSQPMILIVQVSKHTVSSVWKVSFVGTASEICRKRFKKTSEYICVGDRASAVRRSGAIVA